MKATRLTFALDQSGLTLPDTGAIGIFRASSDADYSNFPIDRLTLINTNRVQFDRLTAQGYNITSSVERNTFALTLVEITRSKGETLGLIAQAFAQTQPGGLVLVEGVKTDGIESVLKQCKSILPIDAVLSKSHGKLFWMTRPEILPDILTTWQHALTLKPNKDGFQTADGMFSPASIDTGSALLATHFDLRLKGQVADLGAGWGWLSAQALQLDKITGIDLFEAEQTALEAAKANITDPRAAFHWSDVLSMKPDTLYDAVICNPPFHQGRAAEPALGLDFIRKAIEILKPNGTLWLVANRQLPYETLLEQSFKHWTYLDQTPSFKAIFATKPLSETARKRRAQQNH